ncbi:DUF1643 domain-containing protein [Leptothermofonsia sp. ETS-13]|uniref:DUF1643 domain-containing protein n=1 Tax=Leptothermofonsia sp. ETS-13 TaxID=3035696 RepID=UPI003BA1D1F2
MKAGAILDPTETYRYSLWREWNFRAPRVGFVMLNPSRADAYVDDPTIRRCIGFARSWGFGGLEVVNLFAYRTANPFELSHIADPVGTENDAYLAALGNRVGKIVVAWGNWGRLQGRDRTVISLFTTHTPVYCLGITKAGHPRHPLYLKGDVLPIQWTFE